MPHRVCPHGHRVRLPLSMESANVPIIAEMYRLVLMKDVWDIAWSKEPNLARRIADQLLTGDVANYALPNQSLFMLPEWNAVLMIYLDRLL